MASKEIDWDKIEAKLPTEKTPEAKAKRFDLGRYRSDEDAPEVTFDKPGVIRLYCEIHQHMRATIIEGNCCTRWL